MRSEKVFWITFNIETYTSNAIVHNDKMTDCTGTSVHNSIIFILSLSRYYEYGYFSDICPLDWETA